MIFQTKNAPGMVSGSSASWERPVVLSDGIAGEERKGDVAGPVPPEIAGFFWNDVAINRGVQNKNMDFSLYYKNILNF